MDARLLDLGWIWTTAMYMHRLNFPALDSIRRSLARLDLRRCTAACGVVCSVGNETLVVGECMSSFLLCALWTHLRSVGALGAVRASGDESSDARLHFGGAFVLLTAGVSLLLLPTAELASCDPCRRRSHANPTGFSLLLIVRFGPPSRYVRAIFLQQTRRGG